MTGTPSTTAEWYRRAAKELAETSELQVAWASAIADDREILALIDRLPREHRQPSLVFSVIHWLGAPIDAWHALRTWLIAEWPRVEATAVGRRTQTNEVGRCAPLLIALDRIDDPIALIELGASAGLCLGVDAYSYRFDDGPVVGSGSPLLTCQTSGVGRVPRRLPHVVWRRGVDLAPLALSNPDDRSWLEASLPPDRPDRLARLRAACATLIADPPSVVTGDALDDLPAQLAAAQGDATVVVAALGTLVYLPPARRSAVIETVSRAGARLVTLEPVTALPEVALRLDGMTAPSPTPYALALDGEPIAYASAHGDRVSFVTPVGRTDRRPPAS